MSDAYAKEFEKWLKESNDGSSSGGDTEEEDCDKYNVSYEASLDGSVSDMDEHVDYAQDAAKPGIPRRKDKIFESCEKDSAPILVDDDDEDIIFSNQNKQFEDEPPILEPVPKQISGVKACSRDAQKFSTQNSIRSYSRHRQTYARKSAMQMKEKSLKTYSAKDKVQSFQVEDDKANHSLKPKDSKESGNIFDKFNSMNDHFEDTPPPLIPSPEAMHLSVESPPINDKHPSHSPDFCAMEADSTSELPGNLTSGAVGSRRMSKTSTQGDVSIECDSTCMLGASPTIVSPASVSNSELDEVRDPGGDGHADKELDIVDCKKCDVAEIKSEKHNPDYPGDKPSVEKAVRDNSLQEGSLLSSEASFCLPAPPLLAKDATNDMLQTFPVAIKTELDSDSASGYPNEPPILSVISPTRGPHCLSRKKRHTIDSAETFSRSSKRPCTMPSPRDNESQISDHLSPPTLTHVSETVIACSSQNRKSQHSKRDICFGFSRGKRSCRKTRRRRCNTLPFADLTEYSEFLPENLRNFVVNTTELSQLQTRMHRLLYYLFPQLHLELDTMSPESHRFEELLRDLVLSLEQPNHATETEENVQFQSEVQCNSTIDNSLNYLKQTFNVSTLDHVKISSDITCSSKQSAGSSSEIAGADQKTIGSTYPPTASTSVFTSDCQESHLLPGSHLLKDQLSKDGSKDSDCLSPQLSRLSLRDLEEHLIPVQVKVHRNPGHLLDKFAQLACSAMQLLLPDLAVSLCNELAQSPHDLIVFIDNVILTNSKRKSKR